MKEYKIGDVIYTNNIYTWHDTSTIGDFHNFDKGSAFLITGLPKNRYVQNVELTYLWDFSGQCGVEVMMSMSQVYECFLSVKEVRKMKIQKLNK